MASCSFTSCMASCSFTSQPAAADAPRPPQLQFTLVQPTTGLGEPLIIKYQFTNLEQRRVNIFMGKDEDPWLNMKMSDATGHPVPDIPDPKPTKGGIYTSGTAVDADGQTKGYIVVSRKFQPTMPGQYRLSLLTHLVDSWDDTPGENTTDDQSFSLLITVTARNPQKLLAVAEGLRQTVIHNNVGGDKLATKELFSMRDPVCLPVWRELALDPTLDPWRATDVMDALAKVGSTSAADLLVEMQSVAPERWTQTGYPPLDALESMKYDAAPNLKKHINQLLVDHGFETDQPIRGSAN